MHRLENLVADLDLYISQHAIYINNLERAIEEGKPFERKDCHSCSFGKKWDTEIVPAKQNYNEEIKALLDEIEKVHCKFHELSMQVDPTNPKPEDERIIDEMKDLSAQLIQLLLKLKRLVKKD
ncbi:CZB domain-containing protein [Thermocrinis minervae]|uniref:Chemoreceptor zinc-binding domain-containing protein n=1 Tax=Thermocrinis minervae TaxID=381751 RepID=A0A1M6Q8F2_9AQUI|nr:CZB domain-containing protein [Thermocrinis minervae]SHK16549.1 Chemoreceptor zinc-binding domain-containing protein [Thermocrinis minervae]